ncbi:DUF502 domain-containing protein [Paracoccus jiaweipingae]|uniref:DUF502 domain-containing protein n=1 Tax=unclassified Paracoccus (in: a-proteobacteria) TaxID=2688777 RepID=UPI0037ADD449
MNTPQDPAPPPQPQPMVIIRRRGPLAALRSSFLTGLVVIVPIAVTGWLIWSVMGWIDGWVLPMVPAEYRPERYIGINLRGIGVVLFLVFTILVGWLAKGLIGRSLLRAGERIVDRMPVIRSIYNGVKQIAETIFAQGESRFDRACLVEYPRRGMWGVGFVSGPAKGEVATITGEKLLAVFLPTTPNPTSGFLLYVPERDVRILDMSVEDAAKLIISAGLVYPGAQPNSDGKSTVSR